MGEVVVADAAAVVEEAGAPTRWPAKFALAEAWESSPLIRAAFRKNGVLLIWPKPDTVGVASMKALSLNRKVIEMALDVWCFHSDSAKSPPVDWLKREARLLKHETFCPP